MKGANEYAQLFETGQYGRLYLVSGSHARGLTFSIFVLPDGVEAIPNGQNNPPLNHDAIEVYGATSGHLGWTETYGWLHDGGWQNDFLKMVFERKADLAKEKFWLEQKQAANIAAEKERIEKLLAAY